MASQKPRDERIETPKRDDKDRLPPGRHVVDGKHIVKTNAGRELHD